MAIAKKTVKTPVKKTNPIPKRAAKVVEPVEDAIEKKVPAAIQRKAKRFVELKEEAKKIASEVADIQQELIDHLEAAHVKTMEVDARTFTRVQNEPVVTDEETLKKIIGAPTWNKITTRVLDKGLLDNAIKSGLVTTTQLAQASEVKKSKPYISMSK